MTWFRVDDNFAFHAKVIEAGNAAIGLWVRAGAWSAHTLTDGVIPAAMVKPLGGSRALALRLLEFGLWDELPDGSYLFHDWEKYQPTSAEVKADRLARSEAKAKAGRSGGIASGVSRRSNKEAQAEAEAKQNEARPQAEPNENEAPSLPVPTRPLKTVSADADSRPDVDGLCAYFAAALARNGVKATVTAKWRSEARLLLDKNARPPAEIRAVIDWATQDSFWRANILSVPKLREQYDRLRLAMESRGGRRPVGTGIASHADDAYLEPGVFSDAMQRRLAREAGESA